MHSFEYIKTYRRMFWIKRGMRVVVNGDEGRVTSGNAQGNINVKFPNRYRSANCHPQWQTVYYDKQGKIIADYRNKEGGEKA